MVRCTAWTLPCPFSTRPVRIGPVPRSQSQRLRRRLATLSRGKTATTGNVTKLGQWPPVAAKLRVSVNEFMNRAAFSYRRAFDRNIGWLTEWEQDSLRAKRVAIAGMGGVGGGHLLTLARLGTGAFNIA